MPKICKVDDCGKPVFCRHLCGKHYHRWQRHRDTSVVLLAADGEPQRWLMNHKDHSSDECLIWPYGETVRWFGKSRMPRSVMCELRHGPRPSPKHEASHLCGKGAMGCANPSHLIWETHRENQARMVMHNQQAKGERHGLSKLTADQVRAIRSLRKEGAKYSDLASRFGVKFGAIGKIVRRELWKHV